MTNTAHTPGPKAYYVKGNWRVQIQYSDGTWHTCEWMDGAPYQYETAKDAQHAIDEFTNDNCKHYRAVSIPEIAAPELLEALKVAHDMLVQCMGQTVFTLGAIKNMSEIIEPAIAKAEGK